MYHHIYRYQLLLTHMASDISCYQYGDVGYRVKLLTVSCSVASLLCVDTQ